MPYSPIVPSAGQAQDLNTWGHGSASSLVQPEGKVVVMAMLAFALQTAAQEVARARYVGGMRFIGLLLVIMLVLGIAVMVKKLMR